MRQRKAILRDLLPPQDFHLFHDNRASLVQHQFCSTHLAIGVRLETERLVLPMGRPKTLLSPA